MWRARLLAVVAVMLPAGGCEFDLTPIEVRARAELAVSLQVLEVGGPSHLRAHFYPGSVSPGRARAFFDDSLRVNGIGFAPARIAANGTRVYEVAGLAPSWVSLRIQPPSVVDLPEAPPEITVHRTEVVAPDTLVAARSGQMEITISGVDRVPPEGRTGSWELRVHPDACSSGTAVVWLSAETAPPPVLSVPMSLLPQDLRTGQLFARGHAGQDITSPGGAYWIRVISSYGACIPFRVIG